MAVPSSINQRIANEAKKTIIPLIVLHFFYFVLILGHRYQTQSHYSSEAAVAAQLAAAAITEDPTSVTPVNSKIIVKKKKVEHTNPLEQYKEPIHHLSKELSKAQEYVRIDTEQILQHLETLESIEQNNVLTQDLLLLSKTTGEDDDEVTKEKISDSDVKSALYHWRGLLSIGSLRDIPYDGLEESFHNVTEEIKAIEKSLNDEKLIKQFMFDTSLGGFVVKEQSVFICPPHSDNSDSESKRNGKNRDSLAYAYESDLHHYLKKFEKKFSNRAQGRGIHALLPESIKELEDIMESKMKIILEDIITVADDLEGQLDQITTGVKGSTSSSSSSSVGSSCVDTDLVHTLVEAGLQALLAHGDVREALRKTTLQLDPKTSEDELILDADLPLIDESHIKSYGNDAMMKSINIRSKIDTPLLMKSVHWIDHFIDAIGGYNDGLDQYLDSLTDYRGGNSVGELVVESILEQATLAGDVNVQEYLQKLREMKTHLFQ